MEILTRDDAVHAEKPDGTSVDYFLFPEYEIHTNEVPPGTLQEWHHHPVVEETLVVTEGEIHVLWREGDGRESARAVAAGQVVRVGDTVHTLENRSADVVKLVVVRLVLDGVDKSDVIKSDKVLD